MIRMTPLVVRCFPIDSGDPSHYRLNTQTACGRKSRKICYKHVAIIIIIPLNRIRVLNIIARFAFKATQYSDSNLRDDGSS